MAWTSRWWVLSGWTGGLGVKKLSGLLGQELSFAVVLYFSPFRYLGIVGAVLTVEVVPLAVQRLRRAQAGAGAAPRTHS